MDLATLKEENHIASGTLISQVFAPRYMTRSRVVAEVKEDDTDVSFEGDSKSQALANQMLSSESIPTTPSEWETSSDTPVNPAGTIRSEHVVTSRPRPAASHVSSSAASPGRKRGRHKEYTAPTGVWKTNGGYISTIYVGNRRIYGPLRDNPEEAGVDRQKLIEAKSFVKNEIEMRSYISTLKTGPGGHSSHHATARPNQHQLVNINNNNNNQQQQPMMKKRKPLLTTITSIPTTIESAGMPDEEVLTPTADSILDEGEEAATKST